MPARLCGTAKAVRATTTKQCPSCGETKPLEAFGKDPSRKDGMRNRCRACQSVRNTAWYAANREKACEAKRARHAADPEKDHQRMRAWRAAHPEKLREYEPRRRARKLAAECESALHLGVG